MMLDAAAVLSRCVIPANAGIRNPGSDERPGSHARGWRADGTARTTLAVPQP